MIIQDFASANQRLGFTVIKPKNLEKRERAKRKKNYKAQIELAYRLIEQAETISGEMIRRNKQLLFQESLLGRTLTKLTSFLKKGD